MIVSAGEKKAYRFFIDSNFDAWIMNINQAMHIKNKKNVDKPTGTCYN